MAKRLLKTTDSTYNEAYRPGDKRTYAEVEKELLDSQNLWKQHYIKPLSSHFTDIATKRSRGRQSVLKTFLGNISDSEKFSDFLLSEVVMVFLRSSKKPSLINFSSVIGMAALSYVEKYESLELDFDQDNQLRLGANLLDEVGSVTKAFALAQTDSQAPRKVNEKGEDGERVFTGKLEMAFAYDLEVSEGELGKLINDTIKFGSFGIPAVVTDQPRKFSNNFNGGTKDWDARGMIHLKVKKLAKKLKKEDAQTIFQGANGSLSMRFKVNPVTSLAADDYEASEAKDWIIQKLFAKSGKPDSEFAILTSAYGKDLEVVVQQYAEDRSEELLKFWKSLTTKAYEMAKL